MTDEELKNWETSDTDICNDLHIHFIEWGRWDWCNIAEEGRRVYSLMFGEIENDSPIDAVITAVAAHADHMAFEAMAAALGVDAKDLRCTVAIWSENQDNRPPAVTSEKLMAMVEETRLEFESRGKESTVSDSEEKEPATLPDTAEVELTKIGTIDDGIDGSDEYVLLTRKDDDIDLDQAHNYILNLYYRECTRPGGYFCTSVSVVHAAHSNNTVIATIHHRYDI